MMPETLLSTTSINKDIRKSLPASFVLVLESLLEHECFNNPLFLYLDFILSDVFMCVSVSSRTSGHL